MRLAVQRGTLLSYTPNLPIEYSQLWKKDVQIHPSKAKHIAEEVFLAESWTQKGGSLEEEYCQKLEEKSKNIHMLWPIACRIHVQQSVPREIKARALLSVQQLPFSLPNTLDDVQVDILAAGEKVIHALHVDWTKKLSSHVLEALVLDCRYLGLWFDPILDVLPETALQRALRMVPNARRLQAGSLGLAAYYAWRLNMNTNIFLRDATSIDKNIFELACFS